MTDSEIAALFAGRDGSIYMNTAAMGLAPAPAAAAFHAAIENWRLGRLDYDAAEAAGEAARAAFARIVNVPADGVAIIPYASAVAGLLAAHLRRLGPGGNVVVGAQEYTSNLFAWKLLEDAGIAVRQVPYQDGTLPADAFAAHADADTRLIAASGIQSASGYRIDIARLRAIADRHGALLYIDAAQHAGAWPLDATALGIDMLAAPSHKFLLGTRGMGYAWIAPALRERLQPIHAGWKAAARPMQSFYGPDMELSPTASRFDMSLAWMNALADRESLAVLERIGMPHVHDRNAALAQHLARRLRAAGIPFADHGAHGSTIFSVAPENPAAGERLRAAGVVAAIRAGRVRLSLHVHNTIAEIDHVADLLGA